MSDILSTDQKDTNMEFVEFPKIPRYSREVIVTEKIDGTNGCIKIVPAVEREADIMRIRTAMAEHDGKLYDIFVGSRTRWITPEGDNFGFARWVSQNAAELVKLGEGSHFGEWWGQGIQRGYGLSEKRFSLFNTSRWTAENVPACCHVVPIITQGYEMGDRIARAIELLREHGSYAAPGFAKPEGVIAYHLAGNLFFKKTLEKDAEWKGKAA